MVERVAAAETQPLRLRVLGRAGRRREEGWQVRGMAVEPELRGQGLGTAVLAAILDHVGDEGVWCHARIAARSLYERHGFVVDGEPWDDAVAGTQVVMRRR